MPYIDHSLRSDLDSLLDELSKKIELLSAGDPTKAAGLLNYSCTRLGLGILKPHETRYWLIALVSGVYNNIASEFYRRFAVPYEDRQIEKNGDVFGAGK